MGAAQSLPGDAMKRRAEGAGAGPESRGSSLENEPKRPRATPSCIPDALRKSLDVCMHELAHAMNDMPALSPAPYALSSDGQDRNDDRRNITKPERHTTKPTAATERKSRPTHFLAVRVAHDSRVVQTIDSVQAQLVSHTPGLAAALEPSEKAHVTLMAMDLALPHKPSRQQEEEGGEEEGEGEGGEGTSRGGTRWRAAHHPPQQPHETARCGEEHQRRQGQGEEPASHQHPHSHPHSHQRQQPRNARLARALRLMASLPEALQAAGAAQPLSLPLQGLSSFGNKVLYLDIANGPDRERLTHLHAAVRTHFAELDHEGPYLAPTGPTAAAAATTAAAASHGASAFQPHITIAKMSRVVRSSGGYGRGRSGRGGRWGARKGRGQQAAADDASGALEAVAVANPTSAAADVGAADASNAGTSTAPSRMPASDTDCSADGTIRLDGPPAAPAAARPGPEDDTTATPPRIDKALLDAPLPSAPAAHPPRSIPQEAYAALRDVAPGSVHVEAIELCSMQGRRDGEFYRVEAAVRLVDTGVQAGVGGVWSLVYGSQQQQQQQQWVSHTADGRVVLACGAAAVLAAEEA